MLRRSIGNVVWAILFACAILALIFRIYLALHDEAVNGSWALARIILIFALLYILFMLEGLLLSAVQIERSDSQSLLEFIEMNYSKNKKNRLIAIVSTLRTNHRHFINGRQLLSTLTVVLIALIFASLRVDPNDGIFVFLDTMEPGLGQGAAVVMQNFFTVFLMATLLPCWISQLLPQYIADQRGIEFAQLPLARTIISTSIGLSKLGSGWPGQTCFGILQKIGYFTLPEQIRVGDAAVFGAISGYFGFEVKQRAITLKASDKELTIIDETTYEFFRRTTSDIRHLVKAAAFSKSEDLQIPGYLWNSKFPEDLQFAKPRTQAMYITHAEITSSTTVPLSQDFVMSFVSALKSGLPRVGHDREEATLSVTYNLEPLRTDDATDSYSFDISKPTRRIVIRVTGGADLFIREPGAWFELADELNILKEPHVLIQKPMVTPKNESYEITADYPPLGTKLVLQLDAREPEKLQQPAG